MDDETERLRQALLTDLDRINRAFDPFMKSLTAWVAEMNRQLAPLIRVLAEAQARDEARRRDGKDGP